VDPASEAERKAQHARDMTRKGMARLSCACRETQMVKPYMARGLVIVIMAIDHVRDYFNFGGEPDPMANPAIGAALFFKRWITHSCAPVFVLRHEYRGDYVERSE
jgi:uncharacterized membrane protein